MFEKTGYCVGDDDDLITINKTQTSCSFDVDRIIELLDSLGFVIHPDKSIFKPAQEMEFLGFIINTVDMSLRLTPTKENKIVDMCTKTLSPNTITIRLIAQLLGKFSSSFLAVPRGKLHCRALERYKTESLRYHKGNYNRTVSLSELARLDILWWKNNITGSWAPIMRGNPVHIMTTDASTLGWGAVLKKNCYRRTIYLRRKRVTHKCVRT